MSEYFFGVRRGKLTRAQQRVRRAVAAKHGCTWIYCDVPGNGLQSWFAGPNLGEPFDSALSRAVARDVALAAGRAADEGES